VKVTLAREGGVSLGASVVLRGVLLLKVKGSLGVARGGCRNWGGIVDVIEKGLTLWGPRSWGGAS